MIYIDLDNHRPHNPYNLNMFRDAKRWLAELEYELAHLDTSSPEVVRMVRDGVSSMIRNQKSFELRPATAENLQKLFDQMSDMLELQDNKVTQSTSSNATQSDSTPSNSTLVSAPQSSSSPFAEVGSLQASTIQARADGCPEDFLHRAKNGVCCAGPYPAKCWFWPVWLLPATRWNSGCAGDRSD